MPAYGVVIDCAPGSMGVLSDLAKSMGLTATMGINDPDPTLSVGLLSLTRMRT